MMDKSTSLYVLSHIGDQFCSVMQEERKAITQAGENGNKTSQSLSGTRCRTVVKHLWAFPLHLRHSWKLETDVDIYMWANQKPDPRL